MDDHHCLCFGGAGRVRAGDWAATARCGLTLFAVVRGLDDVGALAGHQAVKRKAQHFTVSALAAHLHRSRRSTLALIQQAGIKLEPIELHHSDDRPRTRRNWRALTPQEVDAVLKLVRQKQGAKLLKAGDACTTSAKAPAHE